MLYLSEDENVLIVESVCIEFLLSSFSYEFLVPTNKSPLISIFASILLFTNIFEPLSKIRFAFQDFSIFPSNTLPFSNFKDWFTVLTCFNTLGAFIDNFPLPPTFTLYIPELLELIFTSDCDLKVISLLSVSDNVPIPYSPFNFTVEPFSKTAFLATKAYLLDVNSTLLPSLNSLVPFCAFTATSFAFTIVLEPFSNFKTDAVLSANIPVPAFFIFILPNVSKFSPNLRAILFSVSIFRFAFSSTVTLFLANNPLVSPLIFKVDFSSIVTSLALKIASSNEPSFFLFKVFVSPFANKKLSASIPLKTKETTYLPLSFCTFVVKTSWPNDTSGIFKGSFSK